MEEKRKNYTPLDGGKLYAYALLTSLVLSFVVSLILMGVASATGDDASVLSQNMGFQFCYSAILYIVLFTVFLLFNRKNNIDFPKATKLNTKPNMKTLVVCLMLGLVFVLLVSPFINCYTWAVQTIGIKSPADIELTSAWEFVVALFVTALLPAVVEEIFYRGVILNGLKRLGKWTAILISAAAFSLMHGNLYQLPYTFGLGVLLGYIAFETGSLLPTILIHFLSNAQVLIFSFFKIGGDAPLTMSWAYFGIAMAFLALAAVIVALALFFIKKFNKNKDETTFVPQTEPDGTIIEGEIVPQAKKNAEKLAATKLWIIAFTAAVILLVLNLL